MITREDPWWWVALGLLIGLLVMDTLIPVYLIKPVVTAVERIAESPTGADLAPTVKPLGLTMPILALIAATVLVVVSVWKIFEEGETRSRWTWMLVAGGITLLWAILMLKLTLSVGARFVGTGPG